MFTRGEGRRTIQVVTRGAPSNLTEPGSPDNNKLRHKIGSGLYGYCIPILLPIASAVTTAIAAVDHGPVRVYWSIGAIAAIGTGAALSVIKERRAKSAHRTADLTKSELASKLADIGFPLLTALGNVTSAKTTDEAMAAINVLIDRSVGLAQTQLGQQTGRACHIRATYYELTEAKDKLMRNKSHTCAGAKLPRPEFVRRNNDHDGDVIRLALGEDARFIRDLSTEPLPYSLDSGNRSYKTLIAVPVRARKSAYGLLTADSDVAYSLNNADMGFLILVAGILAAGIAHMEAVKRAVKS
jgi:hypothetical protein